MPTRQISEGRKGLYYGGMVVVVLGLICFLSNFFLVAGFGESVTRPHSLLIFKDSNGNVVPPPPGFPSGQSDRSASVKSPLAAMEGFAIRGIVGMALFMGGGLLIRLGKLGPAGSGLKLDPEEARRDLEPWARMGGGMLQDALDEAGIKPGEKSSSDLPFDEKLRRLQALRKEGTINEADFEAAKKKILETA